MDIEAGPAHRKHRDFMIKTLTDIKEHLEEVLAIEDEEQRDLEMAPITSILRTVSLMLSYAVSTPNTDQRMEYIVILDEAIEKFNHAANDEYIPFIGTKAEA